MPAQRYLNFLLGDGHMTNIRHIGDKILHAKPRAVDLSTPSKDLLALGQLLRDELKESGGVGITANQCRRIKSPLQMMLVGVPKESEKFRALVHKIYPDSDIPEVTLMLNPSIVKVEGKPSFTDRGEGCLSLLNSLRAEIPRSPKVTLHYYALENNKAVEHTEVFEGFMAAAIQHEMDHLNGIVYIQKVFHSVYSQIYLEQHFYKINLSI